MWEKLLTPEKEYDSSESESGSGSDSSSVVYDHEPFETFSTRVSTLAQELWGASIGDSLKVQRISGGAFNRVIGISCRPPGEGERQEYILRIPRFEAARLDRDVAALRAVHELGEIPIPKVVIFDVTTLNVLGSPYMIQTRLPGESMLSTFQGLDHSRKCNIATKLGRVFQRMLSVKSSVAGVFTLNGPTEPIVPFNESKERCLSLNDNQNNATFYESKGQRATPEDAQMSTLSFLTTTFEARKADGLQNYPLDTLRPKLFDQLISMARNLDEAKWFQGTHNCICHLDFVPQNILIDPTAESAETIITGILDWDSAILAPSFMSCTPPLWIWAWIEGEDEDERTANDLPHTEEGRVLKTMFEEAAGTEYLRYAYSPVYRLARQLTRFAIGGILTSEDVDEAEAMLRKWTEIHQGHTADQDEETAETPDVDPESKYGQFLEDQKMLETEEDKSDWSGRGQHVEFEPDESVPLEDEKTIGYSTTLVESVRCRRTRLARKSIRCNQRVNLEHLVLEVSHLHRLRHPHIIQMVGTYLQKNNFSILLYPVATGDMTKFLEEWELHDKVPNSSASENLQQDLARFFFCLSHALRYMHDQGIRHMNIQPKHILVHERHPIGDRKSRSVYLTGFGNSEAFTNEKDTEGPWSMTRKWCSPEAVAQEPWGGTADIFSLGCVFLEMYTVLAGNSIVDFEEYRARGGIGGSFHATLPKVREWLHKLQKDVESAFAKEPEEFEGPPSFLLLDLVGKMISENPIERPTSAEVVTRMDSVEIYGASGLCAGKHYQWKCCSAAPESYRAAKEDEIDDHFSFIEPG